MKCSALDIFSVNDVFSLAASVALSRKVDVTLKFSAKNVIKLDRFSESDPKINVYSLLFGDKDWKKLGCTETIDDEPNPVFKKTFTF